MPQDKTLSPQRTKQLEDNANLMLQNGYSDAEIQEMAKQFIEKYGEVKKKRWFRGYIGGFRRWFRNNLTKTNR